MTFITVIYPLLVYVVYFIKYVGNRKSPDIFPTGLNGSMEKKVAHAFLTRARGLNVSQNLHLPHLHTQTVTFHDQRSFNRLNAVCRHKHDIMRT